MNSENPRMPPPDFFHGLYGGPRARTSVTQPFENSRQYNFTTKNRSENTEQIVGVKELAEALPKSVEPRQDDILDGCANLMDSTGKRVQVILRDGRLLIGELASVDHFSNLLLRDAVERIIVGKLFGDIIRGIFIIRGDNIVLIGEIDAENEALMERAIQQVPMNEILVAQKCFQDEANAKQLKYNEALKQRGVSFPRPLEDEF